MNYIGASLINLLEIEQLFTVYYFEFSKDNCFKGESHNFWEMVYVDKGKICVTTDKNEYILNQGDIIFHKPNEWHELRSVDPVAPNIAVISFSCNSTAMKQFENKIYSINQTQKRIILRIISEYSNAFSNPLNNYGDVLIRRKPAFIGSEQLLKQSIAELLISLLRNSNQTIYQKSQSNPLINLIIDYMQNNICSSISLNDIIKYSNSNKSTITNAFKNEFGMGAIDYFIHMKIEYAKSLLRANTYNITQIAELLGYSGIHYFSRQFKKITGITPTEYLNSVNSILPPYKDSI
jgi:AraC-like DNA-binding protein